MRRALPYTVAFSALLLAPSPAQAGKIADTQSSGPIALAGNAVVYQVARQADGAARLRLARPGKESRLIFSQRLLRGNSGEPTSPLAASSRRVGYIAFQSHGDPGRRGYRGFTELWTGRPTGPLKLAHTTRTGSGCRSTPFAVAVGDDALATIEGGCGSESRVVLRDYARGGHARVIAHTRRIKALAAAGRYVAWVQTTGRPNGHWAYSIVVYDHARNRVAYRVSNGGWADHLSVQADGKVAGQSANGPIVTAWYSAADRTGHEAPGGSVMPPRLGADRLLFRGSLDPGPTSLVLRDIGSWAPRVVASFPSGQFRPDSVRPNFDFDGRRVAYIQTGATGNELWLVDA